MVTCVYCPALLKKRVYETTNTERCQSFSNLSLIANSIKIKIYEATVNSEVKYQRYFKILLPSFTNGCSNVSTDIRLSSSVLRLYRCKYEANTGMPPTSISNNKSKSITVTLEVFFTI